MSRNVLLLLGLGTIIFGIGFAPLALMRLQMPTQQFTAETIDGVRIVYDVTKKTDTMLDAPLAILLHGFSGNRVMMRMIAFALADQGFICVSVDLRGHGSSEGLMGDQGDFRTDVETVIQSLHVTGRGDVSRIALIGHSMGGGVGLTLGSQLASAVATIGIAPVASPDWVNTTSPKNLLLLISTGDSVINSNTVEQTFYKAVNGTLSFNTPHTLYETERELFVVERVDHLNILYHAAVIDEIVKWCTRTVLGIEQSLSINPDFINPVVYVSLVGGTTVILAALSLVYGRLSQESEKVNVSGEVHLKTLLKTGITAIFLGGGVGSFITLGVVYVLQLITPLFFTNFITALFLGNSIVYGFLTRKNLRDHNPQFSYSSFIKDAMQKSSFKMNTTLGILGAVAFLVLFAFTLGSYTTATLSTASLRVLSLPLYTTLFVFVFVFYESFFKGYARSMLGSGVRRMGSSVLFESIVLFLTFMLELVVITTLLSQVMPFISFGFFVLGLNLLLIALLVSLVSAEVFYEQTGGWLAQILISALIFATLTIVFSPALSFF
jgi:alpha/beta superfamily hydrolase